MCKQLASDFKPASLFLSFLILSLLVAGGTAAQGVDSKTLYTFFGDTAGDALGWSVSGVGDANLVGYDDIVTGTLKYLGSGSAPGYARIASVTYPDDAAVTTVAVNWPNPKAPLMVSASVMNTGTRDIPSLEVLLFLDLNSNKTLEEGEPSAPVVLTDVLTGTLRKAVASFNDPPVGMYLAVAVADPNDLIQESHELNNTGFGPVIIRLPDLVVNGCTWTSAPGSKPGTYDVTLQATIQNIGDATADNVTVSFQYIFLRPSSGKQIKVIRTIGAPVNVGTLQPNASIVARVVWRGVSPMNGTRLYVIVDPNDRIREMSESNEFSFMIYVP
jgi:CARDB protein